MQNASVNKMFCRGNKEERAWVEKEPKEKVRAASAGGGAVAEKIEKV